MVGNGRASGFRLPTGLGWAGFALMLLGLMLGSSAPAQAPKAEYKDGLFISVPTPIIDREVERIKQKVKDARERQKRHIETIVFDFNPGGKPAGTTEPGSVIGLKSFIESLNRGTNPGWPPMTTVAFVSGPVNRHTVLPVLACTQLIMSSKGSIGDVAEGDTLAPEIKQGYQKLAEQRSSPDLVMRMLDRDLLVRKVKMRDGSVRYIDEKKVEGLKAKKEILEVEPNIPPELNVGNTSFTAQQARDLGLASATYESRLQVAEALKMSRQSLREDWLVGRNVVAWRIELNGTVDQGKLDSLLRRIKAAIAHEANLIFLQLDCEGGDTSVAAQWVASHLRGLKDSEDLPIKTVAYIPAGRSLGAATYLALGCNEIAMSSKAYLGDFEYLKGSDRDDLALKAKSLVELAKEQGYPGELFEATLNPELVLYKAESKQNPGHFRLLPKKQMFPAGAKEHPEWHARAQLIKQGDVFKIDAALAGEWGVASYNNVESADALYSLYCPDKKVRDSRDDWLDRVAEFFREPIVNLFLLMIGITGLIIELKVPGIGLPGVIAGICFVLFFWAHSFVGQFTMLAVLLFLLGLVLIGLEIFVTPGFGIPAISGILLVVFSLVLVTLEKMPQTPGDWLSVGGTVMTFLLGMAGAVVAAIVIGSFLPHIPGANRLMLQPPSGTPDEGPNAGQPPYAHLLGLIGVTDTALRPAGKARFGDEFVDVVSEGDFVNAGTRVQVIEIDGNRVVVKPMQ